MPRHRHSDGYIAVVLAGGYVEAGDSGRVVIGPGDVVIHQAYESHKNDFSTSGAIVFNLPLSPGLCSGSGFIDDPEYVARTAANDPHEAAAIVGANFKAKLLRRDDWPDQLAAALKSDPDLQISAWADQRGIARQSVSRGFRAAYGLSPKRFRAEQRTLRAIRALHGRHAPLAALAIDLGFADQPHLSRSIRAMTGLTPSQLQVHSIQDRAVRPI